MGVVNNVSTVTSWQDYLNKVQVLKYPTNADPSISILRITGSSGDYFDASLQTVINGEFSFSGTPASVEVINSEVYSLKNITATVNGLDVDFDFEINDNVKLLKLFPEGLRFWIDTYVNSERVLDLSSNGLPEYAFEKDENGDLLSFYGGYSIEGYDYGLGIKVYENTLEGDIIAPEDAYPVVNDDKIITQLSNILLSEKSDATYMINTVLIPSEELPEELTERIEKVISGEITFSIPENVPVIEIQGIFSTVKTLGEIKSEFYLPLNSEAYIEPLDEYASITYSEGLSVIDLSSPYSYFLIVTNNSMTEDGFIKFLNEPEPETNEDEEWWAMMTALGRA